MMFLTVDSEVGKETLKLLQGLDGITKVQLIKI
jgi:D-3-phosphoglycerate dehydrogenase